jgi:hypothetical protein
MRREKSENDMREKTGSPVLSQSDSISFTTQRIEIT